MECCRRCRRLHACARHEHRVRMRARSPLCRAGHNTPSRAPCAGVGRGQHRPVDHRGDRGAQGGPSGRRRPRLLLARPRGDERGASGRGQQSHGRGSDRSGGSVFFGDHFGFADDEQRPPGPTRGCERRGGGAGSGATTPRALRRPRVLARARVHIRGDADARAVQCTCQAWG